VRREDDWAKMLGVCKENGLASPKMKVGCWCLMKMMPYHKHQVSSMKSYLVLPFFEKEKTKKKKKK